MSQVVIFVQGFVLYFLIYSASISLRKRRTRRIIAGIRLRHVGLAWISLAVTILVLIGLEALGGPMRVGWWSALGGQGSVISGGVAAQLGHPLAKPLMALVPLALLANVPGFALKEEVWFRRRSNRRSWFRNVLVSLGFGLIHMVAGIPLSAALALATFGGILTWRYVAVAQRMGAHSAIRETTRVHATYNATIIVLLETVLLLRLFTG